MFEGKTLLDILLLGRGTMYALLLCSLASITIFLNRIFYYRSDFIISLGEAGKIFEKARKTAKETQIPCAKVIKAGINEYEHSEKAVTGAME